MSQAQHSLKKQLKRLRLLSSGDVCPLVVNANRSNLLLVMDLANKSGLYDTAAYIQSVLEQPKAATKESR